MDVRLPDGTIIRGIPEGTTKAELIGKLKSNGYDTSSLEQEQQPQAYQYGPVKEEVDPSLLFEDRDWVQASRAIYKMNEGRDFEGDERELAEYGLDVMGYFNYSVLNANPGSDHAGMAVLTDRVINSDQATKEAFLYMMDTYDNLEMSWGGVGRFFKGVLSDPTTYVGIGTLGIGTAATQGGKVAGKAGLKELLKQGMRVGTVAAVEGAIYAGGDNFARQSIEISAGREEEYDLGELATSSAIGAGVGMVGGTVVEAGVQKVRQIIGQRKVQPEVTPEVTPEAAPRAVTEAEPEAPMPVAKEGADVQPVGEAEVPRLGVPQPQVGELATVAAGRTELPETVLREMDDFFEYLDLEELNIPDWGTSIPYERQTIADNVARGMSLAKELHNLNHTQIEDVIEQLKETKFSASEWQQLQMSSMMARDAIAREFRYSYEALRSATDGATVARLVEKQHVLMERFSKLHSIAEAIPSHAGYTLRQKQEGFNFKGVDLDDPEAFASHVARQMESKEVVKVRRTWDAQINKALDSGDLAEAGRLTVLRDAEIDDMIGQTMGDKASLWHKANELAISNVFSPRTVQINAIPSGLKAIMKPAMDAILSNPLEAATRKELLATYTAMAGATKTALKAALAAFKYEQAILTRESGRLMEGELAIKGTKGSIIRTLPRLLNMSDEFFSQLTYQGYIAGRTAGDAFEEGARNGLRGKALDRFVNERVKTMLDQAYAPVSNKESIRTVANKGRNLGLTGNRLAQYVKNELLQNPEALRHGHDREAIDYVNDVLFKRKFSGGEKPNASTYHKFLSGTARSYEEWVNKYPWIRLMGQLFFRTPVRVFEEGVRMTPGVQLLAPGFFKDLMGKNGRRAQLRAQGEALMSFAITNSVFMLYATGSITGDGAYANWRQQRASTDGDKQEPYTIRFPDGSTWNYQYFDPIATPVKIIVNALERYEHLQLQKNQGELINKTELDKVIAAISMGTGAIVQAFRDANLMAGVDGIITFGENLGQLDSKPEAFIKLAGEKLRLLVPNTFQKIAQYNDPTIDDPRTFAQVIESRLLFGASFGNYDKTVPKSYDALGNVRRLNDDEALFGVFAMSTPEERRKGLSELQLKVHDRLDQLAKLTNADFSAPYKHPMLGDVDLRTLMTNDGKETVYDRWNRYYRELEPEQFLEPLLDSGAPIGTWSITAATESSVKSTINELREQALMRVISEEAGLDERYLNNIMRRAEVQSGFWDQPFR
jgi:hypothetical protein